VIVLLLVCGCLRERTAAPVPTAVRETPTAAAPRMRFADAVARVERGDDAGARPIFADLLRTDGELADYDLAYLAAIDERAGRPADAAAAIDRLVDGYPQSVWVARVLAQRARLAAAAGDPGADDLVARALTAAGSDTATRGAALLVRADLRAATAPAEALDLYREVRHLHSTGAAAARTRSDALVAAHPELLADPRVALEEGTQLLAEGRLDEASARLEAATAAADREDRSRALRSLAKVRLRQNRLDDAIDTYRRAADAEPPPAVMSRSELATLLWNRDRDAEAAALFERIVRDAPHHAKADDARYALARIAEHAGRAHDATRLYREVVATSSSASLVRDARWRIAWSAYEDGRADDAVSGFADVAEQSPADRAAGLYWEGRARARRDGHDGTDEGRELCRRVLAEQPDSYYAGLCETRLLETAPPPERPEPLSGTPPASLTAHDFHWSRSQALHAVALDDAAARELAALAEEPLAADAERWLLEAYRQADANDRAVRLANRLAASEGLDRPTLAAYLYPRAYWQLVTDAAAVQRLDPYLVLAVMRQESLYDPDAASPAPAYGLMQLILPTAAQVAGTTVTSAELTRPALNVDLGTRYLRHLLDRNGGDIAKALAAYNGGEDAVAKWEARAPGSTDDEFVERISFRETRTYVKTVLGNYRSYRRLYGAPGEQRALP
jgi:soluble lytic murein transglycosylase